ARALDWLHCAIALWVASSTHLGQLRHLYAANFLAKRSRCLLSAPRGLAIMVGGCARRRVSGYCHLDCFCPAPNSPLPANRVAVVSSDAVAGDRNRGGRPSRSCRPLHLPAGHWHLHRTYLAHCRFCGVTSVAEANSWNGCRRGSCHIDWLQ